MNISFHQEPSLLQKFHHIITSKINHDINKKRPVRGLQFVTLLVALLYVIRLLQRNVLKFPINQNRYESMKTIIIQVTTSGTIVLNKNIPYFSCDIYQQ